MLDKLTLSEGSPLVSSCWELARGVNGTRAGIGCNGDLWRRSWGDRTADKWCDVVVQCGGTYYKCGGIGATCQRMDGVEQRLWLFLYAPVV